MRNSPLFVWCGALFCLPRKTEKGKDDLGNKCNTIHVDVFIYRIHGPSGKLNFQEIISHVCHFLPADRYPT
jgi:hypothetical protein